VHVIAAMVWVGGVVVLSTLVAVVLKVRDMNAISAFIGQLRVIGPLLLAPAPLLVGCGVWLVLNGNNGWDFGQLWVQLALGLFGAAFLIGVAFQSRAVIAEQRAAARSNHAEATRQLTRWAWGTRLTLVLVAAATWDMVFRPGV